MQTFISITVSFFAFCGLIFILLMIFHAQSQKYFTRKCRPGDPCRFYFDDEKHDGIILKRNFYSSTVRNTYDRSEHEILNTNIYPY